MTIATSGSPILEIRDLAVRFRVGEDDAAWVRAVDGVDLDLRRGETLGLVGESGCGKSTLARAICGIAPIAAGSIRLSGEELVGLSRRQLRRHRRALQMVFQDPGASLNPRMTVTSMLGEALRLHERLQPHGETASIETRTAALLERVGLDPMLRDRRPQAFSGGQRQRLCIARALAVEPQVLICDEVTSALDVSIQSQILNLLADLQRELGIAIVFITHDLAVVRQIADRVAVMYLGQIVEQGEAAGLMSSPSHPYTRGLLEAAPGVESSRRRWADRTALLGDVPSPAHPPSGCRFHTRCPVVFERCRGEAPAPVATGPGFARCFLADSP